MQTTYDFGGKTALVIGGTTGIGRATSLAFAEAGARVFAAGLGAAEGTSLVEEIRARTGVEADFAEVDVRSEAGMKALHERVAESFGGFDYAFNNAGIPGKFGPVHELEEADFYQLVDVNLKGVYLGLRFQVPHLLARGGGAIVNTSSLFGVMGYAGTAVYCATKYAVIGLTNSVALEVAKQNIRVNAIAPGSVMTPLLRGMFGGEQQARDTVLGKIPMARISDPVEIARLVLFLCSDAASFITGEAVRIDGGGFVAQ